MKLVLLFHSRFVERVRSGDKRHTIRGHRKGRQIQVGDLLSLRYWTAKPYRSKQETIREEFCTKISGITISERGTVWVDEWELNPDQAENLAVQDGFESLAEMLAWHRNANGLPFSGVLIEWKATT